MSEKRNENGEVRPSWEEPEEEYSFDDLARGLASGALSRSRALKLAGAGILGAALGVFSLQDDAEARRRRRKRRRSPAGGGGGSLCPTGSAPCFAFAAGATGGAVQFTCCPEGTKCCQTVSATGPTVTCCRTNSLADTCDALLGALGAICAPGCIPDINVEGIIPVGVDSCQT